MIYACRYIWEKSTCMGTHTYTHTYIRTCIEKWIQTNKQWFIVFTHAHTHAGIYTYIQTYTCISGYICRYDMHMYVCMYTHTHMPAYIPTYQHTYTYAYQEDPGTYSTKFLHFLSSSLSPSWATESESILTKIDFESEFEEVIGTLFMHMYVCVCIHAWGGCTSTKQYWYIWA